MAETEKIVPENYEEIADMRLKMMEKEYQDIFKYDIKSKPEEEEERKKEDSASEEEQEINENGYIAH